MARKRYTTEQIIGLLREAEVRLGQGETIGTICRVSVVRVFGTFERLNQVRVRLICLRSCCYVEVLSAPLLDGPPLDLFAPLQDPLASPEVDVSWRQIVQALVIAAEIVVVDEVGDGLFEITG